MALRTEMGQIFQLQALPDTVFEQMLKFLSFHEIANLRSVSKKFNEICMRLLNQGFRSVEKFHGKCLKVSMNPLYSKCFIVIILEQITVVII